MTALEKAPTILTRAGAEKLLASIRRNLEAADTAMLRAWQGRAWEALGLASFGEFCDLATADLEFVRLRPEARQERVLTLVENGASERDTAAACGVSPALVHADVVDLVASGRLVKPERTRGTDGVMRPATAARPEPVTSVDRCGLTLLMHEAWQRVERTGEDGMTAPELERAARWRHGRTSSLLHRLERVRVVDGTPVPCQPGEGVVFRDGRTREKFGTRHAVYVARPLG